MRILGNFCKLFGGTSGTTPSTELTLAKDVEVSIEDDQIDDTSRRNRGFKSYIYGLRDCSLTFTYDYDTEDEGFTLLQEASLNRQALALFAADDKGNGLDGDWIISLKINQPTADKVTCSVTAKPTFSGENGRNPAWVKATAGA